ncbi:hypothetical protein [Caballeronia sp. INDeC2]|uniref:hypothetical protein n=1 Tax=Caballeronia sp. INDeC2 TaxID=2921747 RepID=UPI002027840F|nr:hypothetical protein [Caballeronia sp. INDeC2]
MDYPTSAALLNLSNLDATTKQRMPTIVDFNLLPDMGRMNGSWRLAALIGSLRVRCARVNARLRS